MGDTCAILVMDSQLKLKIHPKFLTDFITSDGIYLYLVQNQGFESCWFIVNLMRRDNYKFSVYFFKWRDLKYCTEAAYNYWILNIFTARERITWSIAMKVIHPNFQINKSSGVFPQYDMGMNLGTLWWYVSILNLHVNHSCCSSS